MDERVAQGGGRGAPVDEEEWTMMYFGPGLGAWGYLLMNVSMLLFWALLLAGVVVLVRYGGRYGWAGQRTEAILAERFARGEIDEEEYRNRLRTLRGQPGLSPRDK